MEADGVQHDGLICSVSPQSQSIILALALFSIGIFHTWLLLPAATESYLWDWITTPH